MMIYFADFANKIKDTRASHIQGYILIPEIIDLLKAQNT